MLNIKQLIVNHLLLQFFFSKNTSENVNNHGILFGCYPAAYVIKFLTPLNIYHIYAIIGKM